MLTFFIGLIVGAMIGVTIMCLIVVNREEAPGIEPKRGKWILIERREPQFDLYGIKTWAVAYRCSECGFIHTVIEDFGHYTFCPNCGARMERREEHESD